MKIIDLQTKRLTIPLLKPFRTALRTVKTIESVLVSMICDDGTVGIGEAPSAFVITGDSPDSINDVIMHVLRPQIIGLEIEHREKINRIIQRAVHGNSGARAAVDLALHDCLAKRAQLPLYQLLGGYRHTLETDITISLNSAERAAQDARQSVLKGFRCLKIKVGSTRIEDDISRVQAVRQTVGDAVKISLDVNQGWSAKKAIAAIRKMEQLDLGIEFVEQPVPAHDLEGMQFVREHVATPIMADETVFTPEDAARLLAMRGCDLINIKLMKAGGLSEAEKINAIAEAHGVECMMGCMIESRLAVTAACHFAAAKANVTRCDLDAPLMYASDPFVGGAVYHHGRITLPKTPGLGIREAKIS